MFTKAPSSPRPAPAGFSTSPSVMLARPPRPSEGPSPAAGRAGAAGSVSLVPAARRALLRKGTVGRIQFKC